MTIMNRTLTPGTVLTARYKKTAYTCVVEQAEDGTLAFVLADGRRSSSPSAAGSAVMGGSACNGRRFWSLTDGSKPAPAASTPSEPKMTKAARGKLLTRVANQKGAPEGQVRWFCAACLAGFCAPTGEPPPACPAGHTADPAA